MSYKSSPYNEHNFLYAVYVNNYKKYATVFLQLKSRGRIRFSIGHNLRLPLHCSCLHTCPFTGSSGPSSLGGGVLAFTGEEDSSPVFDSVDVFIFLLNIQPETLIINDIGMAGYSIGRYWILVSSSVFRIHIHWIRISQKSQSGFGSRKALNPDPSYSFTLSEKNFIIISCYHQKK